MKLPSIRSHSRFSGLLFVVACGLVAGCGGGGQVEKLPPIYPTTGVIKWKGKPVEGALVSFNPTEKGGRTGTGTTNTQGEFSLETYQKPGCTVGEKIVTVSKMDSPPCRSQDGGISEFETAASRRRDKHLHGITSSCGQSRRQESLRAFDRLISFV